MSTYKIREQRKLANGEYAVIHRETEAELVQTSNGETVEERLAVIDAALAGYVDDLEALIGGGIQWLPRLS